MPTPPAPPPALTPAPARVRYLVRPFYRPLSAALHRLTPTSAGLVVDWLPAPGTPVLLELPGPGLPRGRLARVESAECAASGYLVRCRFATPLSHHGFATIRRELDAAE